MIRAILFTALFLLPGLAAAQVGTPVTSGSTVTIDAHGECRKVTNPGSGTRMVFTGTAPEWQSFIDNPSGLTMEECGPSCAGGESWTAMAAPESNMWNAVTYGNGLFVAVAYNGGINRIMTSPDGVSWTARAPPESSAWNSVTYGGGIFVAVGLNHIMTSSDGVNWTPRVSPGSNITWYGVTYGNGLFVAVAYSGPSAVRIMTSTDGVTWTARAAPENNNYVSVTYGSGLFVAVANTGTNRIMTSSDGINWTARAAPENNNWLKVTHGGGQFVAVATDGTNQIMTSPDGINWNARAAPENNVWSAVSYGGGLFVAVALGGSNRIMTSPDGVTWTARAAPGNNLWMGVTYGNGMFVAVAYNGPVMVSDCEAGGGGTPACSGALVGGHCWYLSASNQNCDQACSVRGGCNLNGIRDFSGASNTNCKSVLDAIRNVSYHTVTVDSNAYYAGAGCISGINIDHPELSFRNTAPATCDKAVFNPRVCACND